MTSETRTLKGMYFQLVETECFQPRVNLMSTCTALPCDPSPASSCDRAPSRKGAAPLQYKQGMVQVESAVMSFSQSNFENLVCFHSIRLSLHLPQGQLAPLPHWPCAASSPSCPCPSPSSSSAASRAVGAASIPPTFETNGLKALYFQGVETQALSTRGVKLMSTCPSALPSTFPTSSMAAPISSSNSAESPPLNLPF